MHELKNKKIVNNLAKPGEGLSRRVIRGGAWVFALRITERAFSLIRIIILARILAPDDFGLMGIALLTMATIETFSQTGFQAALIQKKDNIRTYLDAAWTVLILRGFLLFTILFFIAPYAAIFFEVSQAKSIIQVVGFSVLLQAFTNIGVIYFQKELEFNKQFVHQLTGTLANFVVAVSAALALRSVWALVFGSLAASIVRLAVSYLIHPYRPHLRLDLGKAKELLGFGKWILSSSILIFLLTQGDDIFVGKLLGTAALGFYQMAYLISNMPATEISHVISQVAFPAYSKLQDNLPKLREGYLRTLQFTAFLSFPIAGLIFLLASDFTRIFLGDKWLPMVPAMAALCIFGATRAVNATIGTILQGMGQPKVSTFGSGFQLLIFGAIIYPLTRKWGILGTSIAVVIPNIFFLLYVSRKLANALDYKLVKFVTPLLVPITGIAIMFATMFFAQVWTDEGLISFLFSALLGVGAYLATVYELDKIFDGGLRDNLRVLFKVG